MRHAFILTLVLAGSTACADVQCLLTNYADIASSNIPGIQLRWRPNAAVAFDRPAVSPNGQYWITRGNSEDLTTTADTFLVWGTGTTFGIVAREGDTIPTTGTSFGLLPNEQIGNFNPRRSINNAGQFAFSTPGRGTDSSQNYIVLRGQLVAGTATNFAVMAREGQTLAVPGYAFNVGQFADGVSLTGDGRALWISQRTAGFPILDPKEALFLGDGSSNTLITQTIDGTNAIPSNQLFTAGAPWRSFSIQSIINNAGNNILTLGYLTTGNVDTLALNNAVVLQENAPLPDQPLLTPANIFPVSVGLTPGTSGSAKWFCRGTLLGGGSFAIVNGLTVVSTANAGTVVNCGTERWSNRGGNISNIAANDLGDFVISGGTDDMTRAPGDEAGTDIPGYIRDEVLVANNRSVLLREGDALDLDNNPNTNEFCTITDFETDSAVLSNDGWCYLVVSTQRASIVPEEPLVVGSALIRVRVPHNCAADLGVQGGAYGADGLLDNNDFVSFINLFFSQSPCADIGSQGGVPGSDTLFDNNDFVVFIDRFFEGC